MSVAGGLPRAVERALVHRCAALQIFAKNASQWRGREIPREEVREFRAKIAAAGIAPVVSHAGYLINLATTDHALRRQSVEAMGDELDRAEALGLFGVVLHPGCYTAGSEAEGLTLIAEGLLDLLRARRRGKTMVLLEHLALPAAGVLDEHLHRRAAERAAALEGARQPARHRHVGAEETRGVGDGTRPLGRTRARRRTRRDAHRAGDATGTGGAEPTGSAVAVGVGTGGGFEK